MFGEVLETPQTETTPLNPRSPYGVAKVYAHFITKNYRESFDMYACSGILFNHESPLRGIEFVTKKITNCIASIKYGVQDKLTLGNIDAKRDWGFAGDYTKGMYLMLQQDKPDDYVLATGNTYSVREFVEKAFQKIDIDIEWQGEGLNEKGIDKKSGKIYVDISEKFYRPAEVDLLLGDASKAEKVLGWKADTSFEKLIDIMMDYDFKAVEQSLRK